MLPFSPCNPNNPGGPSSPWSPFWLYIYKILYEFKKHCTPCTFELTLLGTYLYCAKPGSPFIPFWPGLPGFPFSPGIPIKPGTPSIDWPIYKNTKFDFIYMFIDKKKKKKMSELW